MVRAEGSRKGLIAVVAIVVLGLICVVAYSATAGYDHELHAKPLPISNSHQRLTAKHFAKSHATHRIPAKNAAHRLSIAKAELKTAIKKLNEMKRKQAAKAAGQSGHKQQLGDGSNSFHWSVKKTVESRNPPPEPSTKPFKWDMKKMLPSKVKDVFKNEPYKWKKASSAIPKSPLKLPNDSDANLWKGNKKSVEEQDAESEKKVYDSMFPTVKTHWGHFPKADPNPNKKWDARREAAIKHAAENP